MMAEVNERYDHLGLEESSPSLVGVGVCVQELSSRPRDSGEQSTHCRASCSPLKCGPGELKLRKEVIGKKVGDWLLWCEALGLLGAGGGEGWQTSATLLLTPRWT